MTGIELRQALHRGDRVYGTLVASTSPRWVPLLAGMPLDLVFLDTEHIAIDREKLSWMCYAYRYAGLAPVVRVTSPDPYLVCQAIDGGACGVVAPYVETVAEVKELVGAAKRRPVKGRRLVEALEKRAAFEPALERYVEDYNQSHSLIINIESQPAVDILDELIAVPGVDGVLIGPHDLSCSLGEPENYQSPAFNAVVDRIFRLARAAGMGAGIHSWMPAEREAAWAAAGANFFIHSSDIIATREALTSEISALWAKLGDTRRAGDHGATIV